jgi:hypothetical protein
MSKQEVSLANKTTSRVVKIETDHSVIYVGQIFSKNSWSNVTAQFKTEKAAQFALNNYINKKKI